VNVRLLLDASKRECKRTRIRIVPSGTQQAAAMPRDIGQPAGVCITRKKHTPSKRPIGFAKSNHAFEEPAHVTVFFS
jgi:hypothetical protein